MPEILISELFCSFCYIIETSVQSFQKVYIDLLCVKLLNRCYDFISEVITTQSKSKNIKSGKKGKLI
jgi:hypothetical protein